MMGRAQTFLVLACLCLVGCSPGLQSSSSVAPGDSVSSSLPAADCQPAPDWLGEKLEKTLAVRGATLSRLFLGPAANIRGGPVEVRSEVFRSPWWVAALINGVGVRPEVGVWLINAVKEGPGLRIVAADAASQRYSMRGAPSEPIQGDGLDEVRSCVGTPPEP
jgi:hypothetical protein